MGQKVKVCITETLQRVIEVEIDKIEDPIQYAREQYFNEEINEKLKAKYDDMNQGLPQLDEVNQKISNLVQAIAMGGLGSLDTITQEIQRLEHDKVKLTELIQDNQIKKNH